MKKSNKWIWVTVFGGPPSETNPVVQLNTDDCMIIDDPQKKGSAYIYVWAEDIIVAYWGRDYGYSWACDLADFNVESVEDYVWNS